MKKSIRIASSSTLAIILMVQNGLLLAWADDDSGGEKKRSTISKLRDPLGYLLDEIKTGMNKAFEWCFTFWTDLDLTGGVISLEKNTQGVINVVWQLTAVSFVLALIVGGARMAISRRSGLQDSAFEIGEVFGKWLIFSTCIPTIGAGALAASDALAKGILDTFAGADAFTRIIETLGKMSRLSSGMGIMLSLLLACIGIAGGVMQIVALILRILLIPIAFGLTPLFASLSFTDFGKQGLRQLLSYGIAAIVYKPIVAIIYAVIMWNLDAAGDSDVAIVSSIVMLAMAGFIAPTLVKVVVPLAAAAGGAGGGSVLQMAGKATGAVALAAGAVATGGAAGAAGLASAGGKGAATGASMTAGASGSGSTMTAGLTSSSAGGSAGGSASSASGGGGSAGDSASGGGLAASSGGGAATGSASGMSGTSTASGGGLAASSGGGAATGSASGMSGTSTASGGGLAASSGGNSSSASSGGSATGSARSDASGASGAGLSTSGMNGAGGSASGASTSNLSAPQRINAGGSPRRQSSKTFDADLLGKTLKHVSSGTNALGDAGVQIQNILDESAGGVAR